MWRRRRIKAIQFNHAQSITVQQFLKQLNQILHLSKHSTIIESPSNQFRPHHIQIIRRDYCNFLFVFNSNTVIPKRWTGSDTKRTNTQKNRFADCQFLMCYVNICLIKCWFAIVESCRMDCDKKLTPKQTKMKWTVQHTTWYGLNDVAFPIVLEARSLSMHKIIYFSVVFFSSFWSGRKSVCERKRNDSMSECVYFQLSFFSTVAVEAVQKKWKNPKLKQKKIEYFFPCVFIFCFICFFLLNFFTFIHSYHYKCVNVLGALFYFVVVGWFYVLLFKELKRELRKSLHWLLRYLFI